MMRQVAGLVASRGHLTQVVRHLATEASGDVKVPAQVFGIAGKYASALYVSAFKSKKLESVEKEMNELSQIDKTNSTFASFIRDPSVPKDTRVKAIEELLGEAKYSDITRNFLVLLADSGRLVYLPKIVSSYEEILMAHRGEVKATVTAALELTPAELAEVTDALKGMLKPGQTLNLQQKVERSIIGGMVVDIGDKHIDLSIRSRIRKMEKVLGDSL